MSRRRDDGEFGDRIEGVRPIPGRDKLRPDPSPAARTPAQPGPAPVFLREDREGRVSARRSDVSRRKLADLRAGRIRAEREIDLHGLARREARQALLAGLEQARAAGQRCILIIHGAGLHSQDGPVLRSAVPDWLLTGPMAGEVLALAGAPPALGGAGASLVLLRRAR